MLLQCDALKVVTTMQRDCRWVIALFCVLLQACSDHRLETNSITSLSDESNWSDIVEQIDWHSIDWPSSEKSLEIPDDVRFHPEAPFESFQSRVVLHGSGQEDQGILLELNRIKFPRSTSIPSLWSYSSVTRSHIIRSRSDFAEPSVKDEFARVALGLSESHQNTLSVSTTRVSLEGTGRCQSVLSMSGNLVDGSFSLTAEPVGCPVANNLGSLKQLEYPIMSLTGEIGGKQVQGHAWMVHHWGIPPSTQGPVVVDQLRLRIVESDGVAAQLMITRTKRRSGRGPMSVFATHQKLKKFKELTDVSWFDEYSQTSGDGGVAYPKSIQLRISDQLELILDPLVNGPLNPDEFNSQWSTAVRVSGSYEGIGYLDFQPLSTGR